VPVSGVPLVNWLLARVRLFSRAAQRKSKKKRGRKQLKTSPAASTEQKSKRYNILHKRAEASRGGEKRGR